MADLRFNDSFFRKIEAIVTPKMRQGMAELSKMEAHWGIRDEGDLALIMGVLNFGDPAHRLPNNSTGVPAPIPPRPWLSNSVRGAYDARIKRYVNKYLPVVLRGMPKVGTKEKAVLTPEKFIKGLALTGMDNARQSWDSGKFEPNAPYTLENKTDPRPLHDTGRMNEGAITAWTK